MKIGLPIICFWLASYSNKFINVNLRHQKDTILIKKNFVVFKINEIGEELSYVDIFAVLLLLFFDNRKSLECKSWKFESKHHVTLIFSWTIANP